METLYFKKAQVFPARAGMIPPEDVDRIASAGIPRESGDDPRTSGRFPWEDVYSPRERG